MALFLSSMLHWTHQIVLVVLAICSATVHGLDISVPLSAPSSARPIAGDHVSFSLEQDRWLDWSGSTSRNEFFYNTLDNLRQLSGVPPQIRIGANSQDRTNFNPALQAATAQTAFPPPTRNVPYPEASSVVVGDAYFATARFLPKNTRVIWGVNLGQNNLTSAFLVAQAIARAFDLPAVKNNGIVLDGMIIGNEADLFPNNGHRAPGWTVAQYISEWKTFASNITDALKITTTSNTKFWGAAFAGSSGARYGFSPQTLFNQGLLNSAPGSLISTISQHAYSGSFCEGTGALLQDLMTKANIRGNLSRFTPDIAATRARGLDYVMGETNSFACHGTPGVSNVAGAALWTLDYLLYGAQVGMSRIFFHQGIGFKYNLIQPATLTRSKTDATPLSTPLLPHIQPQYYSAIIAAEAIGSKGTTRIAELNTGDSRISGYAFYDGNTLVRAILINSLAFFKTSSPSTRQSTRISISFAGAGGSPRSITIKQLEIPHADDETGLTWGGVIYETPDGRPRGTTKTQTVGVADGFDIRATEVLLLTFNR